MLRPRAAEKEFFTLLKFLYPIDVGGDDAMEPRSIDEEIDLVAFVEKEADVLKFVEVDDSNEEHVSDTPRLSRPRASRPKAGARPEVHKYPAPKVAARLEDPALFVITLENVGRTQKISGWSYTP